MKSELFKCLFCNNPKCQKECKKLDLENILLGCRLKNENYLSTTLPENNPCTYCTKGCFSNCVATHNVNVDRIIDQLYLIKQNNKKTKMDENKLKFKFFDKVMENPFMLSSSVVSSSYDKCKRALEMGWAGFVYKTITYMEIKETSPRYEALKNNDESFRVFKNIEQLSKHTPEEDFEILAKLRKEFPSKIIIASIMGRTVNEWVKLAQMAQEAGCDGVELNFSCPNMEEKNTGSAIGQQPEVVYKFTKAVKDGVKIPVIAKLTPNVQNMKEAADAACDAKADGISAINTIMSLIGNEDRLDIESVGGLSGPGVKPIALRFINELRKNEKSKNTFIFGIGGIENWKDALDFLQMGANACQITTAIMQYGYRIIKHLKTGLLYYLENNNIKDLQDVIGKRLEKVVPLDQRDRNTINYPCFNKDKCVKCGRCYISCRDGGQDALTLDKDGYPMLDPKKCEGCHLCVLVCPNKAITPSKK